MASSVMVLAGGYFWPLSSRGGDAHVTFRTGVVEPKAAAYEFIRTRTAAEPAVTVLADDWWLYWPMRYLALPERQRIFVEMLGIAPPVYPPGVVPPRPTGPTKTFAVVFAEGVAWHRLRSAKPVFTASDPLGRAIVHVLELPDGVHHGAGGPP